MSLLRGSRRRRSSLINMQIELRKCCNHPYLIKGVEQSVTKGMSDQEAREAMTNASGKLILLDKLLPKLKSEGHRVLIFSQFVMVLQLLGEFLTTRGYSFEQLDGSVTGDTRQAAIDRFCKPGSDIFAFLLSTRAGGVGINLTAADTCILYDSDWNPQNDVQAMARSHRIGQRKRVKVFRLVTRGSYEAELVTAANKKLGLERAFQDAKGVAGGSGDVGDGKGPPKDHAAVERMLRNGAQDIALDDDSAFRKFSEADIDSLLQMSAATRQVEESSSNSLEGGGSFSKVAFVADGQQIDMSDPEFWSKILPAVEATAADEEDYDAEVFDAEVYDGEFGGGGMRKPSKRQAQNSKKEAGGSGKAGKKRSYREADFKQYHREEEVDWRAEKGKRTVAVRKGVHGMEFDSDGEDAATTGVKLWPGAHAVGWRLHVKGERGKGKWHYVAPDGVVYDNRASSQAAEEKQNKAGGWPVDTMVLNAKQSAADEDGERLVDDDDEPVEQSPSTAEGMKEEAEDAMSIEEDDDDEVEEALPVVKLKFEGKVTVPACYGGVVKVNTPEKEGVSMGE